MLTVLLPWLLLGCPTPEADDSAAETDGPPEDSDTGFVDPDLGELTGILLDPAGQPFTAAEVNLCKRICRTVTPDATGRFSVPGEAGTHSLHVHATAPAPAETHPEPLFPVTLEARTTRDVSVTIPALGAALPLPNVSTELEVIPGFLWMTTVAGGPAIPFSPDAVTTIAGVRFEPAQAPALDLPGTLLGGFHLAPYQARESAGTPLRLANAWDLAPGTTVAVHVANYNTFAWVGAGELVVNAGGTHLEGAAKLPEWTTVALTTAAR